MATIVRWEPFRSSLFNTLPMQSGAPLRRWLPAMDLVEADGSYVLRADLPGLSQDDVSIELDERVLTISGERKSEHESSKDGYRRVERAFGSFKRSVTLPEGVDPEAISAGFENGVLEVSIPKPTARVPRKIEIGGGQKTIEAEAA
jgi:HSP20 family protein